MSLMPLGMSIRTTASIETYPCLFACLVYDSTSREFCLFVDLVFGFWVWCVVGVSW